MAFFDDLERKFSQASSDVMKKTKDLTDIARLNSAVSSSEKNISGYYGELGKIYYEQHGANPEGAYQELCDSIAREQETIVQLKEQIRVLKGLIICENCGKELPSDAMFCNFCGTKVEQKVVQAPEVPAGSFECPACGASLEAGTMFCYACGQKIE